MKTMNKKLRKSPAKVTTLAALAFSAVAITGCGKNDSNAPVVAPVVPPVVAPVPGGVSAGCVPVNQPIPFTATNVYFDWANMVGGRIPYSNQNVGNVIVGGGVIGSGTHRSVPGADGTIVANITQGGAYSGAMPYPNYNPYNNWQYYGYNMNGYSGYNPGLYGNNYSNMGTKTANVQGTITIGQLALQDIMWKFGNGGLQGSNYFAFPSNVPYQPYNSYYYPGYPGAIGSGYTMPNASNLCVSGIAFDLGHWDSQGVVYGGRVYLYLNNTEHGYVLWF